MVQTLLPGERGCLQLSQARGASRDLTSIFMRCKSGTLDSDESEAVQASDPKSRFLVRNVGFASMKSPDVSLANDKGALLPTSTKASSEEDRESGGDSFNQSNINGSLNLSARHLPPVYVDIQEEIEHNLDEIRSKTEDLSKLHKQRIKDSFFSNSETLQLKSLELSHQITNLIKQSDRKLKELSKAETSDASSEQIRKNMQAMLAQRLKDATMNLRKMEKQHFMKVQEIHGVKPSQLNEPSMDESQILEQEDTQEIANNYNVKEISQLTDQINSLAVLFKDFSVMVTEQGTILDRIDYNIENAAVHIEKANENLEKALEVEKSSRARSCMIGLFVGILIMLILLVIKWST